MALTELKFKRPHIKLTGTLVCRTGLRIGGSKEDIEIGGMDNPILRDPVDKLPYMPGSSLKGKMRSLLEYKYDRVGWKYDSRQNRVYQDTRGGEPCGCGQKLDACPVCTLFGPHMNTRHELGPSRIIVRDAHITDESKHELEKLAKDGLQYAEVKTEVSIDRTMGTASRAGPRSVERVPKGTKFDLNISLRIFEGDDEGEMLNLVKEGLRLMQEDYLGGSGTRGYGWVKIEDFAVDGHGEAL